MTPRSLEDIVSSGARVSQRELFRALTRAGFEVTPTSKPTHWKVRGAAQTVIVATRKGDILPVYVSRLARALGLREGGS